MLEIWSGGGGGAPSRFHQANTRLGEKCDRLAI